MEHSHKPGLPKSLLRMYHNAIERGCGLEYATPSEAVMEAQDGMLRIV